MLCLPRTGREWPELDLAFRRHIDSPDRSRRRVAVVVGGTQGIGLGCAHALAERGMSVLVASRNPASRVGARGFPMFRFDTSVPAECRALFEYADERFGHVDLLVNSAVHFVKENVLNTSAEDWHRSFAVNLWGPLLCAKEFVKRVVASGRSGIIINISSTSGQLNAPGYGIYGATKAALDSMTQSLSWEWGSLGVRVCGIAPAHTATPGILEAISQGELSEEVIRAVTPLRRLAAVSEIVDALALLTDVNAHHLNGLVLRVDGGRTAS